MQFAHPVLLLAFLPACERVAYQPVDLQLDVEGALPEDAATLHVCVEGAGENTQGAGDGQGVFTGIPVGPVVVWLDLLDDEDRVLATAGPAEFAEGDTYLAVPLGDGGAACQDDGAVVPEGQPSLTLGFRVVER